MEFRYSKDVSNEFVQEKLSLNVEKEITIAKKMAKISKIKQKKCYLCSSTKSKPVSHFFGINYLMCQNCNHVYTDKRVSDNVLTKFYAENEDYFKTVYTNTRILRLREQIFRPKIKHVKRYSKGKKWLDIGSGDGAAVVAAKSEGFDVLGIEISDSSRRFAKKYRKIELYGKPLLEYAKSTKPKWDIISFFGVLEHLPDPVEHLGLSNRLLKKDGIIVLELPNYNSLSTQVQNVSKLIDRHLVPYAHIMMFTLKSAKFILNKTGFRPISCWFWGQDVLQLLKYLRLLDKQFANSDLSKILSENINQLQLVFDKNKMSDEFMIIGRKFKSV